MIFYQFSCRLQSTVDKSTKIFFDFWIVLQDSVDSIEEEEDEEEEEKV